MLMASWKYYHKQAFSLTDVPACETGLGARNPANQRTRPDSRSTKISTSATAL